ncbi:GNAT family N-acetyltransferase [Auraticoccus monumenti]|uniref:Ribosomal protein S18 acetylase RimI n=1 Tax=Auraticoccus monumenti TaxID=675864 RepID=A0A1G6VB85_9ACTN|nr:GNAT family N-acetyltransferase [Auraticoccus monumenti]SDD50653.1 Ribosomal protein S18 acetylase RimI [Auraticoccus monumenti]
MTEYRWDHLHTADVEAWAELTNTLARVDETEEHYSADDLAEELVETGFDARTDSVAVWDGERLVGYGQLRVSMLPDPQGRVRCTLSGGVHPDHRGRGLGRELMDRLERRAVELAAERHPGRPAYWRASGGVRDTASVRALLEHRGYSVVRWFNEMKRPLPGEPLATPAPAGVRLLRGDEADAEAVREAHNLAFRDHWGSAPQTPEAWRDFWGSRTARHHLSTVAVDGDGDGDESVLGYVLCSQWVERELYVGLVGTVPAARGRGVARAALAETIRRAGAAGEHDVVELGVDSASPTGATRLYDALGFSTARVSAAYQRDPA